jgi:hypothetical protein
VAAALSWVLFYALPRWYATPATVPEPATEAPAPQASRKIKAHLFYVAEDGRRLASIERDVPFGETPVEQARAIITAQIAPPPETLVSAVPSGTSLRAIFITAQGEAYLDLSGEIRSAHPGGSRNELLTVYTLVDALTVNLPAVSAVQLLVDGQEVETLAGHVDLRRPLVGDLTIVE